jgi:hypothetical protein
MPLGAASGHYSMGVELLNGNEGLPGYSSQSNSEYHRDYPGSESASDNVRRQNGNNLDRQLRSQSLA